MNIRTTVLTALAAIVVSLAPLALGACNAPADPAPAAAAPQADTTPTPDTTTPDTSITDLYLGCHVIQNFTVGTGNLFINKPPRYRNEFYPPSTLAGRVSRDTTNDCPEPVSDPDSAADNTFLILNSPATAVKPTYNHDFANTICAKWGTANSLTGVYLGYFDNPAESCFDYSSDESAPSRVWTSYFGCCLPSDS